MSDVAIYGLNQRQQILADILWTCDTRDTVDRFILGLPSKELQDEAKSIVDLIILSVVEQCYDGSTDNMDEAKGLISKVSRQL
jgi:hypothetical protein